MNRYLAKEDGVAAIWLDAPVLMLKPRATDIPIAIKIASDKFHHIGRRPPGVLKAPAPTSPVISIAVTVLVQNPGAEHRLDEGEELLYIGLQELR
jgi:hypothetical protein